MITIIIIGIIAICMLFTAIKIRNTKQKEEKTNTQYNCKVISLYEKYPLHDPKQAAYYE